MKIYWLFQKKKNIVIRILVKMIELNHLENIKNLGQKKELSRDVHLQKVNNKLFQKVIKKVLEVVL